MPDATELETITMAQAEAADAIGLHDDLRRLLAGSHREIAAQVPLRMDDVRLRVLTAHRVQHNGARGPYRGAGHPRQRRRGHRELSGVGPEPPERAVGARAGDDELSRRLVAAHGQVWERAGSDGCSLRQAAHRLALSRVAEAERLRGSA